MRGIRKYIKRRIENLFQKIFRIHYYIMSIVVFIVHHKTFGKYKNYFQGKDVAIIATGPSLNKFKHIDNITYIGLNKAFYKEDLNFDFIFMQDWGAIKSYMENITNEKYKNVVKFYGVGPKKAYGNKDWDLSSTIIPQTVIKRHKARKYYLYVKYPQYPVNFNVNIANTWIQDCTSVAFSAMQFALFTNPRKIYLVGCDCSSGYFDGTATSIPNEHLVGLWKEIKKFADIYYPETEIICVNPVGLKGVFQDLYQE